MMHNICVVILYVCQSKVTVLSSMLGFYFEIQKGGTSKNDLVRCETVESRMSCEHSEFSILISHQELLCSNTPNAVLSPL